MATRTTDLAPTTAPRTPAQHDARMCSALRNVSTGHFNSNGRFIEHITNLVKSGTDLTPRQRWWLTTLVVRHRRQLGTKHAGTVAIAQAWLREHAEPQNGPQMSPMTQMNAQASNASASVTSAPSAEKKSEPASTQPELF